MRFLAENLVRFWVYLRRVPVLVVFIIQLNFSLLLKPSLFYQSVAHCQRSEERIWKLTFADELRRWGPLGQLGMESGVFKFFVLFFLGQSFFKFFALIHALFVGKFKVLLAQETSFLLQFLALLLHRNHFMLWNNALLFHPLLAFIIYSLSRITDYFLFLRQFLVNSQVQRRWYAPDVFHWIGLLWMGKNRLELLNIGFVLKDKSDIEVDKRLVR